MTESKTSPEPRRGFLAKMIALLGGAAALLTPTVLGVISFLNPLRQKGSVGEFSKLTSLDVLPKDGSPMKFPIIADRVDAWNRSPNETIGAVYLRRLNGEGGTPKVVAFQMICPHAGCSIMFQPDAKGGKFYCPCHSASFDLAGIRTDKTSPSPRDMDSLECEVRNGNEVWLKFQTFSTGTSEKKVQA